MGSNNNIVSAITSFKGTEIFKTRRHTAHTIFWNKKCFPNEPQPSKKCPFVFSVIDKAENNFPDFSGVQWEASVGAK